MDLAGLGDEPGERALHVPLLAGGLLPHHLVVGDGLAVGRGADVAVAVRELGEIVGNTARVLLVITYGERQLQLTMSVSSAAATCVKDGCLLGCGQLGGRGHGDPLVAGGVCLQPRHGHAHLHQRQHHVRADRLHAARQLAVAARGPAELHQEALGELGEGLQRGRLRRAEAELGEEAGHRDLQIGAEGV